LAEDVASRLIREPGYVVERRSEDWGVIGRIGAPFHNNTPWDRRSRAPAVAGILHDRAAGAAALAGRRAADASGFFAAALGDGDRFWLATDRRASVPVFFAAQDGFLIFAPEVKGVLAAPGLSREPDLAALGAFLASGHLIGDQTLFREVRRLRGGQELRVGSDGSISLASYWRFRPGTRAGERSVSELGEALADRVEDSVSRNLAEPERSAILLSGGADSRGMLCVATKLLPPERIHAVTWAGDSGDGRSDLEIACAVAQSAGVRHHLLRTTIDTYAADFRRSAEIIDGLSDLSPFHPQYYRLAADIAEIGFTTVLRGDEVFGWWHPVSSLGEALMAVGLRSLHQSGVAGILRPDLLAKLDAAWTGKIADTLSELDGLTPGQAKDALYFDHRLQGYLNTGAMLRQVYVDHRNPLLDEAILDFMEQVPDPLRLHKLLFQQGMARRFPELWRIGIAGSVNTEDWRSIYARDAVIRGFIQEEFEDSRSAVWDYLDRAHASALLDAVGSTDRGLSKALQSRMKSLARSALEFAPPALMKVVSRAPRRAPTSISRLIMRVLALKYWCDTLRHDTAPEQGSEAQRWARSG
jgi:asparagine synthetase B (glutamine-hydrolysing)